jgi:hypothetical protein
MFESIFIDSLFQSIHFDFRSSLILYNHRDFIDQIRSNRRRWRRRWMISDRSLHEWRLWSARSLKIRINEIWRSRRKIKCIWRIKERHNRKRKQIEFDEHIERLKRRDRKSRLDVHVKRHERRNIESRFDEFERRFRSRFRRRNEIFKIRWWRWNNDETRRNRKWLTRWIFSVFHCQQDRWKNVNWSSYFLTDLLSFVSERKTCEWFLLTTRSFSFFYLSFFSLVFIFQHSLDIRRCYDQFSRIRRTSWTYFSLSTISCFEYKNYRSF